jgi:DNA helicase-2/ATP-dependent DNA helicase PcrA
MMLATAELNENQRAALEASERAILVLAGPGSGKTKVLTLRIARIIDASPEDQFRVLGLTFTNKAAAEMRRRVGELLQSDADRALLTTFHSFAGTVLRQHGSHIGVRPDFAILTQEEDRQAVLADAIKAAQPEHPDIERSDVRLLPLLENLLTKLVGEDEVPERIRDPGLAGKVDVLYRGYRAQLLDHNALDFSTLLCFAYELLRERPAIARQYRSIYPHVLVDEFQDTNFAQCEFLRALVGSDPSNLFVVADDDQMIYQWNGADPQRLQELQAAFDMEVVQLPTNYRCPPSVIKLANALIAHNPGRGYVKEPLVAGITDEHEDSVTVRCGFASVEQELEWIADEIAAMPRGERSGCVVLARSRKLLIEAQTALDEAGVEAVLGMRKSDFESAPLRWLVATLRLAVGRGDVEHLRTACTAFFGLEAINLSVEDIRASSAARGGDLLRSFKEEALAREELSPATRLFLNTGMEPLVERMEHGTFIDRAFEWFAEVEAAPVGADERASFVDFAVEEEIWQGVRSNIESRYGGHALTLAGFLQEVDLSSKELPIPPTAVRCFTIHNAKGMEFPRVYLLGLAEDVLPSFQAIKKGDASSEMQEERRNCFVAITRTRERLTLTYAQSYFRWPKAPSRFLLEMGLGSASKQKH